MVKIKNISYKIVNGKWKSERMAKLKGENTYPVLITIIETIDDKKIEIPLSYIQIGDMIKNHLWLEKIIRDENTN